MFNKKKKTMIIATTQNDKKRNQAGQGMLEYILIVVFVAIAGIATWKAFGAKITEMLTKSTTKIDAQTEEILEE